MASRKSSRVLKLAETAIRDLAAIWQWNAQHYSPAHADSYVGFLRQRIDALAMYFSLGRRVPGTALHYLALRRKPKGHGHLAVYRFDEESVYVLHVFHTAQDWQTAILESPG